MDGLICAHSHINFMYNVSVKFLFVADSSNITTEQTGFEIYCSLKIGLQHNDPCVWIN